MNQTGQHGGARPGTGDGSGVATLSLTSLTTSKPHCWGFLSTCAALLMLSACQPTLDTETVATDIYDDLDQSGLPLEAVNCPENIPLAADESFQCWGELSDGIFAINVVQEDDQGAFSWDVPNSAQVINLSTLETYFRNAIRDEMGEVSTIDCGGDYRVNRPGDRFDCSLGDAIYIEDEERQLEAIQVQLDSQGNVNWQQVRNLVKEEEATDSSGAADETEAVGEAGAPSSEDAEGSSLS